MPMLSFIPPTIELMNVVFSCCYKSQDVQVEVPGSHALRAGRWHRVLRRQGRAQPAHRGRHARGGLSARQARNDRPRRSRGLFVFIHPFFAAPPEKAP